MITKKVITILCLSVVIVVSCRQKKTGQENVKTDSLHFIPPIIIKDADSINVFAYLVYDDGSLSSFNVLNDSTKVLWNTIIGAGDSEKPSEKTKLVLRGNADGVGLMVNNGSRTIINKEGIVLRDSLVFIIDNTGCQLVSVDVTKGNKPVFKGTIEFHCGE